MSQPAQKLSPLPDNIISIGRVYLHDSIPEIAVSKTLSKDTLPDAKMTYIEGAPILTIQTKVKSFIIPITNIKAMLVK